MKKLLVLSLVLLAGPALADYGFNSESIRVVRLLNGDAFSTDPNDYTKPDTLMMELVTPTNTVGLLGNCNYAGFYAYPLLELPDLSDPFAKDAYATLLLAKADGLKISGNYKAEADTNGIVHCRLTSLWLD